MRVLWWCRAHPELRESPSPVVQRFLKGEASGVEAEIRSAPLAQVRDFADEGTLPQFSCRILGHPRPGFARRTADALRRTRPLHQATASRDSMKRSEFTEEHQQCDERTQAEDGRESDKKIAEFPSSAKSRSLCEGCGADFCHCLLAGLSLRKRCTTGLEFSRSLLG